MMAELNAIKSVFVKISRKLTFQFENKEDE